MKKIAIRITLALAAIIWVTFTLSAATGPQRALEQNLPPEVRGPRVEIRVDAYKEEDVVQLGVPVPGGCSFPSLEFTRAAKRGKIIRYGVHFGTDCQLKMGKVTEAEAPRRLALAPRAPLPLAQVASLYLGMLGLKEPRVWEYNTITSMVYTTDYASWPRLFFSPFATMKTGTLYYRCCDWPNAGGWPPYAMTSTFSQSCSADGLGFRVRDCDPETDIWDNYYGNHLKRSAWGRFSYTRQDLGGGELYHGLWEGTEVLADQGNGFSTCLWGFSGTLPFLTQPDHACSWTDK